MDSIKMQIEILKCFGKNAFEAPANLKLAKDNSSYYISPYPNWFVVIRQAEFLLKLPENANVKTFEMLIENGKKERVQVVATSEMYKYKEGSFIKLFGGEFSVWVNAQKLKLFGKPENLKFMCGGATKPVFIYENDILLGCIAPRLIKQK